MASGLSRVASIVSLACGLGLAIGCSASTTAPTPTQVTVNFSGTINPLGSDFHTFPVNYTGGASDASVEVTSLTTVATGAPVSITVGLGFGIVSLGVCNLSIINSAAPLNTALPTSGEPFTAGTYCIEIFDNTAAPTVTQPLNYMLSVTHY
jgi:hypothetical protein